MPNKELFPGIPLCKPYKFQIFHIAMVPAPSHWKKSAGKMIQDDHGKHGQPGKVFLAAKKIVLNFIRCLFLDLHANNNARSTASGRRTKASSPPDNAWSAYAPKHFRGRRLQLARRGHRKWKTMASSSFALWRGPMCLVHLQSKK